MEKFLIFLAFVFLAAGIFWWVSRQGERAGEADEEGDGESGSATRLLAIEAEDNAWGIPLIDLRPVTHSVTAWSENKESAENAVSYGRETGEVFFEKLPREELTTPCSLRYSLGEADSLLPGVLFVPESMEEKWAVFCDESRIAFVRSWQRKVLAWADYEVVDGAVILTTLHGDFGTGATGEFLIAELDFLMRSHVLGEPCPVPVETLTIAEVLGTMCFSSWGNRAEFAAVPPFPELEQKNPLASHSLLHIALAQNERERVLELLEADFPVDCLARDGLATLHWAAVGTDHEMVDLLLSKGCPIDVRSREGATLLMTEAQDGDPEKMKHYLSKGADPNARDDRGFTALHRAAEIGVEPLVRILLDAGADPAAKAEGHTPLSLAESRGNSAIVDLLTGKSN